MMRCPKPEFVRHLVLQGLDIGREEFNDLAALRADHVVVMLVIVVMFVVGLIVAEPNLAGESRLGKKLERSIHGCMADRGILLLNYPVKVVRGQVFLGTQKRL